MALGEFQKLDKEFQSLTRLQMQDMIKEGEKLDEERAQVIDKQ